MNCLFFELLLLDGQKEVLITLKHKQLFDRYQQAMNTIYRSVNNILKEIVHSELSKDQFLILQYIHNNERCTSTQIASAFAVGKSSISAQVQHLFEQELIDRIRDKQDRRIVYLSVTKKGSLLVKQTEKDLYAEIGTSLEHFDIQEVLSFVQSLEKLAQIMKEKN